MGDNSISGTILTRHGYDTSRGIELTYWLATHNGPAKLVINQQQAVCFIKQQDADLARAAAQVSPLELLTLDEKAPVCAVYFQQQRALLNFRQQCKQQGITLYEADIKPPDRYLMERFITCAVEFTGTGVAKNGHTTFINPRMKPGVLTSTLSVISLDIETDGINGNIISIACSWHDVAQQRQAYAFIQRHPDWHAPPKNTDNTLLSIQESEAAMLQAFFAWLQQHDPDIIIGWNVIGFDLAYIQKRCAALRLTFDFARGDARAAILLPGHTSQTYIAAIPGRLVIDGIEMLRAAFWTFERFSLEFVAQELLGRGKLIDENHDKVAEIQHLYAQDPDQLLAYNILDCQLVEDIFDKTGLINFTLQRSQLTGLALGRIGGSVAAFDNLYLPRLHRRGFVAKNIDDVESDIASPGGFVMDSKPGLYENVLVFDFKSLYPSIIRSFLIDPLGLILDDDNQVPGFHGASFSRDNPILPELITTLWASRDSAKQQNDAPLSQAIKIIMNSFYGVLGTSGCRFHHHKLASSITRRGHEIIQNTRDHIEAAGFSVIYGDTDSVFILLGPRYSHDQAQQTGMQLLHTLNQWWQTHLVEEYAIESCLELEFETHFSRFLMPTTRGDTKGSKKRYAGIIEKDGERVLIFKGMESVRSDWTPLARNFQRELYQRIFNDQAYTDLILETVERLNKGELDQQLSYRKRLRKPLDTYTKNVPPHVQAARKSRHKDRWIRYFITVNGPEPADNITSAFDYDHYIERQLAPAADSLLNCLDTSFAKITSAQLSMF